ncbi:MAG: hypothetical protein JRI80_18400 [Deltaproteobacteria bacterium]|nr:hypothetical protein [Deltaproteobacteria bacterium]
MSAPAVHDFEDMLSLLEKHGVRYLIIGGLAFAYHAMPRYTKDIDLWIDPAGENLKRANEALKEFGSPFLLDRTKKREILQLGIAPNRIDLLLHVQGARFQTAWEKRIQGRYGKAPANWIDLDSLIRIKSRIDSPRHREDARVLREVRKRQKKSSKE